LIALAQGRPRDALRWFESERRANPEARGIDTQIGQAWSRLGDRTRARAAYLRELRRHPDNREARDSLAVLEGRAAR
jgi:predicted Zn-dependent protease